MKKRPDADLRVAASFCCRMDAAIDHLKFETRRYEQGCISAAELLQKAAAVADRINELDIAGADDAALAKRGISVERKVAECRECIRETARIAMSFTTVEVCRRQALEFARMAVQLRNRAASYHAHDLIWAATGGLPTDEEFEAFEACEMLWK